MTAKFLTIAVRESGEVTVRRLGGDKVLSHRQIDLATKPDELERFMEDVKDAVRDAFAEFRTDEKCS